MADEIKYQINVQIADNTVTKDDPDDKIFNVVSQGTADKERVIAEMMAVNPGLERETLRHVLDLENRVVMKLLLNGMRVNNGLFEAAPQCKGVVRGTAWDPAVNSIYVNFKQGKEMREAIRSTTINVIGEKGSTFYLSTSLDAATGATDFSATPGANLTLTGKNIKVAGDDPSVGIALIASDDSRRHRREPALEARLRHPRHPRRRRLHPAPHDAIQRRQHIVPENPAHPHASDSFNRGRRDGFPERDLAPASH